eukprot:scaffold63526_cov88-Cyclotella_meneghiniana.AAC.2
MTTGWEFEGMDSDRIRFPVLLAIICATGREMRASDRSEGVEEYGFDGRWRWYSESLKLHHIRYSHPGVRCEM